MRDRGRSTRLAREVFFVALSGAIALACAKTPEPEGSSAPKPAGTTAARPSEPGSSTAKPAQAGPSDLGWDAPAAWQKAENPSAMRKATYKIPKAQGDAEDAEMSVSMAGGSVDANVQRWAGQFQAKPEAVKKTPRTVNGLSVTVVEIQGTFAGSGMPGAAPGDPKASWALLGAIVETSPGMAWFFKMTGPDKTVSAAKADFEKMVDSIRAK